MVSGAGHGRLWSARLGLVLRLRLSFPCFSSVGRLRSHSHSRSRARACFCSRWCCCSRSHSRSSSSSNGVWVIVCVGRSTAQAPQQRKVDGLSSVQIGHVHDSARGTLSVCTYTPGADCGGGFVCSGTEGGRRLRDPAGFVWLGGMYEDPYFSRSSSSIISI